MASWAMPAMALRGRVLTMVKIRWGAASVALSSIAVAIATAPISDGLAQAATPPSLPYLAVIDAGSSGTRLDLFAHQSTSLHPRDAFSAPRSTPGLSSFQQTPQQAGPGAIAPLLAQLDAYLRDNGIANSQVPIAMLATAGMRNVRSADPLAAQAILDSTANAIAVSGHPLADNQILPGIQEASLAWLDANAILGTLNRPDGGIGTIEVGGASAQVAFRSPHRTGKAVSTVHVAGMDIPVVAVSYLGLGGNDARTLMQGANDAGSFCFPNNTSGTAPLIYQTKATRPVNASTAHFSWNRCAAAYEATITSVGTRRSEAAPVPPSELRSLPGFAGRQFLGLGSIPLIFRVLGADRAPDEGTALRAGAVTTCTGPGAWTRSAALYPAELSFFAETLCSTATYEHELIFSPTGVGIRAENFSVISPQASEKPSWTAGYAITKLTP